MGYPIVASINKSARPFLSGANIWTDGGSITSEVFTANAGWPRQTQLILGTLGTTCTVNGFNGISGFVDTAVSGQCTRNMIGDRTMGVATAAGGEASIEIDGKLNPAKQNILIVGGDGATNDLYYYGLGVSDRVQKCQQNTRDYCKARQLAGWYVILMSGSPRANGYDPGGTTNPAQYEADSLALDRLLEATHQEYANLFFDFRRHLPFYTPSAPYCAADGIHPTTYGAGLIANKLAYFLIDNLRTD